MRAEEALQLAKSYTRKTLGGGGGAKGEKGDKGDTGASAYDIWLSEGNVGTEDDFLLALKGEQGIAGGKGEQGEAGNDGKSAYEYAKDGGYTGTEEEFSKKLATENLPLYQVAGYHNSIYRGKRLGTAVTEEQWASIEAGTFDDLYIGDYWVIGGTQYRIAAFDYYLNCGDTSCTTHHAVIVPDTCLYNAQMHNTSSGTYESGTTANTTAGGYVGSDMYTTNLESAKTTIKNAFSGHVLKHRIYLTNAVANGRPSAGAWCDSEVDLMCEEMVYGTGIFRPTSDGTNVPANYRVEKSQLPLFAHEPSRICNRNTWWLRDVVTASNFAGVTGSGIALYYYASGSNGVRPAFCIS